MVTRNKKTAQTRLVAAKVSGSRDGWRGRRIEIESAKEPSKRPGTREAVKKGKSGTERELESWTAGRCYQTTAVTERYENHLRRKW
jgi:hypothetical protein